MIKSILEGVQRPKDLVAGCVTIRHPTGCFVTRKLIPPAWIYDQVHHGGSIATEGSGGEVPVTTSPPPPDASSLAGSFLQHGFTTMPKSILEGA
ncbi:MAG: hypothetical protein FWF18_04640 [Dehalococcoidia bacterium]|nr:hypothetical protein [Dehalococcoidia bacterium]